MSHKNCKNHIYKIIIIIITFFLQGDSIESSMGMFMVISTMAAAALGNTLSDVLGIGLSSYVERGVMKLGFSGPNLSPIQLDMKASRVFANLVSFVHFKPKLLIENRVIVSTEVSFHTFH